MAGPSWYESLPAALTEADYIALPIEIARTIEVVHGHVIKRESPAPQHNRISRRLANALEAERPVAGPCLSVETGIVKRGTPPQPPSAGTPEILRRSSHRMLTNVTEMLVELFSTTRYRPCL